MKSKDLYPPIFSRHASEYQRRLDGIMGRGEARGRMRVIELASARRGMRVLDLACGPGNLSRLLAKAVSPGGEVVGVDLAPGMIELARSAGIANARFEVMDIENLAFDDSSFDVVTCGHGLQFCPDLPRALAEAHRVLRPGGRFVASVPVSAVKDLVCDMLDQVVDRWLPARQETIDQERTRTTVRDVGAFERAALGAGFASARVEVIEEHVHWESAEYLVSMLTSWWDFASRMEGMDPARKQEFMSEAVATLKEKHPGAIETTGRNHVLLAGY